MKTKPKKSSPRWWGLARSLVRYFSSWAWLEEITIAEGTALIEEMHSRPGSMEIAIKSNPAHSQWVAQCFANLVAASPNYTEMTFDLVARGEVKNEWLTVLVRKGSGKTPHQLRVEAEKECDELRKKISLSNAPVRDSREKNL